MVFGDESVLCVVDVLIWRFSEEVGSVGSVSGVWGLDGTGEGGVREERRMRAVMG